MPPLIQLRNVEKSYQAGAQNFYVLRRISLDIQAGEFVTFMGPSGAGKSTLLGILGMLDSAWSGEYFFLDQPVHKLNTKQRNELHKYNIGFVFQSYHLIDDLTVYENLEMPLSYKNIVQKQRASWSATLSIASILLARRIYSPINFLEASNNLLVWPAPSFRTQD